MMRKYGFRKISWLARLKVSPLSGCHKVKIVALISTINITNFNPLVLVLIGINTPRKNDSSINDGNRKSEKGSMNTIFDFRN
jgi:hypothetical protein